MNSATVSTLKLQWIPILQYNTVEGEKKRKDKLSKLKQLKYDFAKDCNDEYLLLDYKMTHKSLVHHAGNVCVCV